MAESISLQNGNIVKTEDNPNHDVQLKLNDDGSLSLLSNIKFPKGAHGLKLNDKLLKDTEFGFGEVELKLEKPIGKDGISIYTTSSENTIILNIKITINENGGKKYMLSGADDKKWMFGG